MPEAAYAACPASTASPRLVAPVEDLVEEQEMEPMGRFMQAEPARGERGNRPLTLGLRKLLGERVKYGKRICRRPRLEDELLAALRGCDGGRPQARSVERAWASWEQQRLPVPSTRRKLSVSPDLPK